MFKSISSFDSVPLDTLDSVTTKKQSYLMEIGRTLSQCVSCFETVRTYKNGTITGHSRDGGMKCYGGGVPRSNVILKCLICENNFFQDFCEEEGGGTKVTRHLTPFNHVCGAERKLTVQIQTQGQSYYKVTWSDLF